jgi:putative DNA methylase
MGFLYHVVFIQAGILPKLKDAAGTEVPAHLTLNVPNYYGDMTQRELVIELADYLARKLDTMRPDEASAARVLRELAKNQRLG